MATIRRSGSGWQVLIRKKNYVGPRSKTFQSRDLAESWANAVEERTKKVFPNIPITLGDAISDYINGPLLLHRSAENEKYPLRVTAKSWLGDIPLKDLQIRHLKQKHSVSKAPMSKTHKISVCKNGSRQNIMFQQLDPRVTERCRSFHHKTHSKITIFALQDDPRPPLPPLILWSSSSSSFSSFSFRSPFPFFLLSLFLPWPVAFLFLSFSARSFSCPFSQKISNEISESWTRCVNNGLDPFKDPKQSIISSIELKKIKEKNESIRKLIIPELELLYSQIAGTNFMVGSFLKC